MLTEIQSTSLRHTTPQIWDKPTASAQIGDYFHVPFMPVMCVVDRDVLEGGQVWLLVKPVTGSYSEEWVLEPSIAASPQQPAAGLQEQPAGLAGDSVSCQRKQPSAEVKTELEQGRIHGQNDALAGWHPIYTQPLTEYATGYLSGYNEVLNPRTQQPEPVKSAGWSATWDDLWQCYRVWAGDRYNRYVGSATTYQDAERLGQQDAALDKTIKRQNAAVMAAYASVVAN